ncbi:MAG: hypothetical protein Q8N26_13540 [Myxococcales bacterium]|nr:hypothetical protein [Myxococcales bacterium]
MVHALLASVAMISALPMPGDAETKRFNDSFERAEALYSRGEYGAAIALFRDADRMKVTPEVAFDLARSFEKLGDVEFATLYDRLYLQRAPDASDAKEIVARVERTLSREEDDGQSLLEVFSPGALSLTIAGRHFPAPPAALFLPPGEYVVEGAFSRGTKRQTVQVKLGEVTTVWFEPVRPPLVAADVSAEPAVVDVVKPVTPVAGPSGTRIAAFIAMGLGAAALGTGLVMGALASSDASRSADRALTVREAREAAAASNGKATVANVLFIAGGVAAATGGALFVISMPEPGMKADEATR